MTLISYSYKIWVALGVETVGHNFKPKTRPSLARCEFPHGTPPEDWKNWDNGFNRCRFVFAFDCVIWHKSIDICTVYMRIRREGALCVGGDGFKNLGIFIFIFFGSGVWDEFVKRFFFR